MFPRVNILARYVIKKIHLYNVVNCFPYENEMNRHEMKLEKENRINNNMGAVSIESVRFLSVKFFDFQSQMFRSYYQIEHKIILLFIPYKNKHQRDKNGEFEIFQLQSCERRIRNRFYYLNGLKYRVYNINHLSLFISGFFFSFGSRHSL